VRTQKALEQAAAEIKRLREKQDRERAALLAAQQAGSASGQRAAAEAAAAWEAEREEVRRCWLGAGWWMTSTSPPLCGIARDRPIPPPPSLPLLTYTYT
jgi:hypothetical protein